MVFWKQKALLNSAGADTLPIYMILFWEGLSATHMKRQKVMLTLKGTISGF